MIYAIIGIVAYVGYVQLLRLVFTQYVYKVYGEIYEFPIKNNPMEYGDEDTSLRLRNKKSDPK